MSILIRGLEMPEDNSILLRIFPPIENGKYKGELYVEQLDRDMDFLGEYWGTEIKTPHGRLGDLDELLNRFVPNQAYFTENIIQKISTTRTIIEAEGEEEHE